MKIKAIQQKQKEIIATIQANTNTKPDSNTKDNTIKKHITVFNNFNTYCKQRNITEINNDNIRLIYTNYINYLKQEYKTKTDQTLAENTINQYMIIINKLLKNECELKIKSNWYIKQKTEKTEPQYITYTEYNKIINHIDKQIKTDTTSRKKQAYYIDKMMIKLLYNTGLRIHEALKIKIADILTLQIDNNNVYQYTIIGKGNKARDILISKALYDDIIEYIQQHATKQQTYLFENTKLKKSFSAKRFEKNFYNIAADIDAAENIAPESNNSYTRKLKPHNLRHSYAMRRLERGTKINVLQKLLGHNNITTTQIYTAINKNNLSDAAAGTLD